MSRVTRVREPHVLELRSVFSPLAFVLLVYAPLLLLYAATDASLFGAEFGSRKTLSLTGFAFFALALLAFVAGARAGETAARRRTGAPSSAPQARELNQAQRRSLRALVQAALLVSIGAYVLWFALGAARAGGPLQLLEIWRSDPHRIKAEFLTTLPGVTTLTQLAVAAIPLAVAFGLARRGSAVRVLVVVVFVLATVRAVVFNERLALIELVVPLVFLAVASRKVTVPRVVVYGLAALTTAMTLFAVTELRRTYVYTQDFSPTRSAVRFLGYYLTSVNNGMMVVDEHPARTPLYATGAVLWEFPVLGDLRIDHLPALGTVSLRYADMFGIDPLAFWPREFDRRGLDYEFNVFTTPGYLAADFGWPALAALLLLGIVTGRFYAQSARDGLHGALYALWLVGLFEFMRILYFTNTRVFPAYLVLLAAALVLRRQAAAPEPRPLSMAAPGPGSASTS